MANDPRFEVFPRKTLVLSIEEAKQLGLELGVDDTHRKAPWPEQEFAWRFRDANGRITFIGGEGFTRREDAHRAVHGAVEDVLTFVPTPEPILRLMRESVTIIDVPE